MTLRNLDKSQEILKAMLIHEDGMVSHRGFRSYDAVVAYRERNKRDRVILEEGTI